MATSTSTSNLVTLHQPKAKTPAERAAAYRARKKGVQNTAPVQKASPVTREPVTPPVTSRVAKAVTAVTPSRPVAPILLSVVAFGLAAVGITMNGWYSHSLGSSPVSSWVFCAIGVAADLMALAIPACAASKWQAHQRGAALAGWLVWLAVFVFTSCAGVGFASVNVADVTTSRASRVTPQIETAKALLADAVTSRDRECKDGIGKNCRAREEAVDFRRKTLDAAMLAVEQSADPQTQAASHIVAWLSAGLLKPSGDDFAMLRLILLALLPQLGGILLMLGRRN